jgi:hypothetical protein
MNKRRLQVPAPRRACRSGDLSTQRVAGRPSALGKPALRLLTALAEEGSEALPDPTCDGMLILRAGGGAVSLGRGSHALADALQLLGRDLVEAAGRGPRRRFTISPAGLAHLRRRAAASEPFRAQQTSLVTAEIQDETGTSRVTVNAAESPLDWLRRHRDRGGQPLIDAADFEAGERLRRDIALSGMVPSVTARWEGAIGGGGPHDPAGATDTMIAARQRSRAALAAIGPDHADLLVDLCGFLKGLELIERERRWPPRSAKVVVRMALRQLAAHYGLASEAAGPAASRGIRCWRGTIPEMG